jgi:hypothetical protein
MMQRTMLCRQHVASTILLSLDAMWMEIIAGLSETSGDRSKMRGQSGVCAEGPMHHHHLAA